MSPEKKIFLRVLLLCIIAAILLLFNNLFITKDTSLVLYEIASLSFIIMLFFISKRLSDITIVSKLFGLATLFILNITWFQAGGYKGSSSYLFIMVMLFLLVVFNNSWRKWVVPVIIINIIILFFLEYKFPDEVRSFNYPNNLISHGLILILVISLAGFMMSRYKKYYFKAQHEYEDAINLLKEKNSKIEEQNHIISDQNIKLKNYSKGLENDVFKNNLELEKRNKELQVKNANLEKFASIIAHDLKLPISQISGLLQIIPSDFTDDFRVEEIIYRLRASTSDLQEITNDLSRVVDVELSNDTEVVNLTDILLSELEKLNNFACKNNTEIIQEIEADIKAKGNADFYSSIFNNILHNAIKFSSKEKDPKVNVSLISNEATAFFKVIDNGIGYRNNNEEGIGMYRTGQAPLSGKGYGLYLVKSQLDKIGGQIKINGKEIKGTEVKVSIPL